MGGGAAQGTGQAKGSVVTGSFLLAKMTHAEYQNLTFRYWACVILARTNGVLNAVSHVSPGTTRREEREMGCVRPARNTRVWQVWRCKGSESGKFQRDNCVNQSA